MPPDEIRRFDGTAFGQYGKVKKPDATVPLKQLNFFVIYQWPFSKENSYFLFLFRRGGKATPEVRGALGDHLSQLTLGSFQVRSAHTWVFSGTVISHFGLFRYSQLTLGSFQLLSAHTWAFSGMVSSHLGLFRYSQLTLGSFQVQSANTWVFSGTVSSHLGLFRYSQLTLGSFQAQSALIWIFQVQSAHTWVFSGTVS
jgi:hypothetical protein